MTLPFAPSAYLPLPPQDDDLNDFIMQNLAHAAQMQQEVGGAHNFALPLRGNVGPASSTPESNTIKCAEFPPLGSLSRPAVAPIDPSRRCHRQRAHSSHPISESPPQITTSTTQ